ncbi:MAG: hypothetical protein Q9167_002495, partial [Letrouitia subvulpina]
RRIRQEKLDVMTAQRMEKAFLIGTYMSIQGRFVGVGTWRASDDHICAVSRGATWICSVLPAIESDDMDEDGKHFKEKVRARL